MLFSRNALAGIILFSPCAALYLSFFTLATWALVQWFNAPKLNRRLGSNAVARSSSLAHAGFLCGRTWKDSAAGC